MSLRLTLFGQVNPATCPLGHSPERLSSWGSRSESECEQRVLVERSRPETE